MPPPDDNRLAHLLALVGDEMRRLKIHRIELRNGGDVADVTIVKQVFLDRVGAPPRTTTIEHGD